MRRRAWREPAWFAKPTRRLLFIAELAGTGVPVRQIRPPWKLRGGFAVRCAVVPPGVEPREVTICFGLGSPEVPVVFVDGPTDSPHRYENGALCMWWPYDGRDRRWLRADGAAALLGHIVAHLVREEWWRRTNEWAGDEAPHGRQSEQEVQ